MISFRNLKKLADVANAQVKKRGGTESLKQDAEELRSIAKGKGSIKDKAKAAGKALKDPGSPEGTGQAGPGQPGQKPR